MTKSGIIALLALAPAASIAAPLPANLPVYGQAPGAVPPPVAEQPAALSAPAPVESTVLPDSAPPQEPAYAPYAAPQLDYTDNPRGSFSAHFLYGFNASPRSEFATDVFGVQLHGSWFFTPHQAITLDLSFAGGTDYERLAAMDDDRHAWMERFRFYRSRISLMPGYEVCVPLNRARNAFFYVGAKAGLDIAMLGVSDHDSYYYDHGRYYEDFHSKATAGFAYAGAAGFSFRFSHHGYVEIGYQYFGSTAEPDVTYRSRYHNASTKLQARSMRWHEVHAGLSFRF